MCSSVSIYNTCNIGSRTLIYVNTLLLWCFSNTRRSSSNFWLPDANICLFIPMNPLVLVLFLSFVMSSVLMNYFTAVHMTLLSSVGKLQFPPCWEPITPNEHNYIQVFYGEKINGGFRKVKEFVAAVPLCFDSENKTCENNKSCLKK